MLDNETAKLYVSYQRTLFIGRLGDVLKVSKAPSVLLTSLYGELELTNSTGQSIAFTKSVLIPADSVLEVITGNTLISIYFLDFIGEDVSILSEMSTLTRLDEDNFVYVDPVVATGFIESMRHIFEHQPSAFEVFSELNTLIQPSDESAIRLYSDERVTKAVDFIRSRVGVDCPIDEIAKYVSLSVPRFTQLFRQVTGISVRRFKVWYRMYLTVLKLSEGKSFTEAAISAGFSDYAHFSRSFSEMGGIAPTTMFQKNNATYMDVYIPEVSESQIERSDICIASKKPETLEKLV
jgi:AraC-like DNA-binding protein